MIFKLDHLYVQYINHIRPRLLPPVRKTYDLFVTRRGKGIAKNMEYAVMIDEHGPHYFVAFQTPGPNWVKGVQYNEQPEFFDHVGYMTEMQDKGMTILSGPFMKVAGGLNGVLEDGGMTIFEAANYDEAVRIATDDPTVRSGMLKVEVKTFWVPFHR